MIKSELIAELAKIEGITPKAAQTAVKAAFESMTQVLADGGRVEIRGFGTLTVRDYEGHTAHNPRTLEFVDVEARKLPFFKAGKELRERFNSDFGETLVTNLKQVHLENYQQKRIRQGVAVATIDREIGEAKTMINRAIDNDMIGGETIRKFKKVRKLIKGNSNARDRIDYQQRGIGGDPAPCQATSESHPCDGLLQWYAVG